MELPAELVDVAAAAGVRWPEADETAMASSAAAWRQAGTDLATLGSDADSDARAVFGVFDGDAADAARLHWDGYVREDGRLPVAVRECTAAADRLDHGAEQVTAAKTEIVRQLVALKQQQDAARTAGSAGLTAPLTSLTTIVAGTATSVAQVTEELTRSIALDNGTTVGQQPLLGQNGPAATLTGTITGGAPSLTGVVTPGTPSVSGVVTPAVDGVVSTGGSTVTGVVDTGTTVVDGTITGGGRGPEPAVLPALDPDTTGPIPVVDGVVGGDPVRNLVAPVDQGQGGPGSGSGTGGGAGAGSGGRPVDPVTGAVGAVAGTPAQVQQALATPSVDPAPAAPPLPRGDVPGTGGSGGGGGGGQGGGGLGGGLVGSGGSSGGAGGSGSGSGGSSGGQGGGSGSGGSGGGQGGGRPGPGGGGGLLPVAPPAGGTSPGGSGSGAGSGGSGSGSGGGQGGSGGGSGGSGSGGSGGSGGGGGNPGGGQGPGRGIGVPLAPGPVGPPAGAPGGPAAPPPAAPVGRVSPGIPLLAPGPIAPALPPTAGAPGPAIPGPSAPGQPGAGPAGPGAPGTGHAGSGSPGSGQPGAGQPGTGQPGTGHAGSGQPGTGHAGAGQPGSGQPGSSQSGAGQSGSGQPGASTSPDGKRLGSALPAPGDPSAGRHAGPTSLSHPGVGGPAAPGQAGQPAAPAPAPDPDGDQNRGQVDQRRPRIGVFPGFGDFGAGVDRTRPGGPADPDDPLSAFLFFLFPRGEAPVPSARPARQVTAPPVEVDFAAGLRFAPGDHPESALVAGVTGERATPLVVGPGLDAHDERVRAIADGHDPLGGQHEREWERRFLVREAAPEAHVHAEYAWPPSEAYPEGGCAPDAVEAMVLPAGTVIDRFGDPGGRVFAADATPFAQRSLPPEYQEHGYRRFRVERPLPVWRTVSAGWFGQPGGGVRYRATHAVTELLALGHLTDVTREEPTP